MVFMPASAPVVTVVDEMLTVGSGDDLLLDFKGDLLVDLVERILFRELVGNFLLIEEETLLEVIEGRSTVMLLLTLLRLVSMLSGTSLRGGSSAPSPRTTTCPKSTANFLHQTDIHLISWLSRSSGRVSTMSSEEDAFRTGTCVSR